MSAGKITKAEEISYLASCGLAVDFDYSLMNAAEKIRSVFLDALKEFDIKVSEIDFVSKIYGAKLNGDGDSVLRLFPSISDQSAFITELNSKLDLAVKESLPCKWLCKTCRKVIGAGGKVVFITSRSSDIVRQLIKKAGLEEALFFKTGKNEHIGVISDETWRYATQMLKPCVRPLLAVATSALSVKNAIKAGMYVAALTNPMFEFQDYSGVDIFGQISDDLSDRFLTFAAERA